MAFFGWGGKVEDGVKSEKVEKHQNGQERRGASERKMGDIKKEEEEARKEK